MHSFPYYQIAESAAKAPLKISVAAASSGGAAPTLASGAAANYVLVSTTTNAYLRWGRGAQTAVTTDMLIPAGETIALAVMGATHFAAIRDTADGVMTITAIEFK